MWDHMSAWSWGEGWGPGIFWFGLMHVIWWALVIMGMVALIRWMVRRSPDQRNADPALDILRERYARGEIDKTEFEQRKRDLAS